MSDGNGRSRLPRLLSVRAISEATTLPLSTVYDLIANGEFPAVRIGRSIRVPEADLARWIETNKERAR
jgi:excisionase family DNA binding protein